MRKRMQSWKKVVSTNREVKLECQIWKTSLSLHWTKSEFPPGVSWPGFTKLFVKMIRLVRTRLCWSRWRWVVSFGKQYCKPVNRYSNNFNSFAMSRQRLRLPTLLLISSALILQTSDKEVSARGSLVRDVSNTRFHQLKYLVIVELVISVSN